MDGFRAAKGSTCAANNKRQQGGQWQGASARLFIVHCSRVCRRVSFFLRGFAVCLAKSAVSTLMLQLLTFATGSMEYETLCDGGLQRHSIIRECCSNIVLSCLLFQKHAFSLSLSLSLCLRCLCMFAYPVRLPDPFLLCAQEMREKSCNKTRSSKHSLSTFHRMLCHIYIYIHTYICIEREREILIQI